MNGTLVTYNRETRTFDVRIQVECPPEDRDDAMTIVQTFVDTFTAGRVCEMHAEPRATLSSPWGNEKVCRVYARFTVQAL
jgi:hypothetical protein